MSYPYRQPPPGPGYPPPPAAPAPGRRIDAMDVLEGVLTDGFSIANLTRIARASGSNFWLGATLGAGLVMLLHRPDVRATLGGMAGGGGKPRPGRTPAARPPAGTTTDRTGLAQAADQQGAE